MTTFPLPLTEELGHWGAYGVYLIIGFAFGFVLELSGFGNSKKLAAQFYFKDLTVLKVMFGAIITAMVLIFFTSAVGLLDYNLIWVNPTYWLPGILGGLIMGVGFIVGGFCPGTSMVAAATLKLDGIFFLLGVFFGIFLFGETVGLYEDFWYSTYEGRLTLEQFLGIDTGIIIVGIILMAIFVFWGGEYLEHWFGGAEKPTALPRWRYGAAGALLLGAVMVMGIGQPTAEDRWNWIEDEKGAQLENREVQIHPAELLKTMHDDKLKLRMLDVRDEADYNLFHILDAERVDPDGIVEMIPDLQLEPANTVFVVMSNDEAQATEIWKTLVAESVPNVYILEGGVNNWISLFGDEDFIATNFLPDHASDQLAYHFDMALGARQPMADPNPDVFEGIEFPIKIIPPTKRGATSGGCG